MDKDKMIAAGIKQCNNCKHELPIEAKFCPYCMTELEETAVVMPMWNKKRKEKIPIWLIPSASIVALAICIVVGMKFIGSKEKRQAVDAQTDEQIATELDADGETLGESDLSEEDDDKDKSDENQDNELVAKEEQDKDEQGEDTSSEGTAMTGSSSTASNNSSSTPSVTVNQTAVSPATAPADGTTQAPGETAPTAPATTQAPAPAANVSIDWGSVYSQVCGKLSGGFPSHTFITNSSAPTEYGYGTAAVVSFSYTANLSDISADEISIYQAELADRIYRDLAGAHGTCCTSHIFVGASYSGSGNTATFYGYFY